MPGLGLRLLFEGAGPALNKEPEHGKEREEDVWLW
jgi:hypothetical protein